MKELIKIFFVFTFFTLSLSQFYTFYPELGIYDYLEGNEGECENCPDKLCENKTKICIDNETDCIGAKTYGKKCMDPCSTSPHKCVLCNRTGEECYECPENKTWGIYCNKTCKNCPEGKCQITGQCFKGDFCDNRAYYGDFCNDECNKTNINCSECFKENGTCSSCEGNKFWDTNCTKPCNDHCPDDKCDINGLCNNTNDNCFKNLTYGTDCLKPCKNSHENCSTCDRSGDCLSCVGYKTFGSECSDSCELCPKGECEFDGICINQHENCLNNLTFGLRCNENCSNISCGTCNRDRTCITCPNGTVFGEHCNKTCNCPGPKCEIDGTCVDYYGKCINDTFYGPKCDEKCNKERPDCVNCDIFGKCTNCSNETYFGDNCTGFCDKCPEQKCYMDGNCIIQNETCSDPYVYGPNCSIPCDFNNTECNTCLRNGTCDSCKSEFYWGPKCNDTCAFCPDGKCDINGKCINTTADCVNETHYGDKCDIPCSQINENCTLCNRNKTCLECVNRTIFGVTCNQSCDNCPINNTDEFGYCYINGTCYNDTGLCNDTHYTGDGCTELCSDIHPNCSTCDRLGICSECNDSLHYGNYCQYLCDNCPINNTDEFGFCYINGTCYNDTGLCNDTHYTGDGCTQLCSEIHPNCSTCDRLGICSECNDITLYGNFCNQSCSNCPDVVELLPLKDIIEQPSLCYINGTCKNLTGLCRNFNFTGDTCNVNCSLKYENCKTCDRDNICFDCIDEHKYGNICNTSCDNCPDGLCYNNGTCKDQDNPCKNKSLTGKYCDKECISIKNNCLECDRKNICLTCKDQTFFGVNCTEKCDNCPGEPRLCNITGDCLNQTALCIDTNYTGSKCDKLCNETIDRNCKLCDRENNCFECFNKTKFGNKCQDSCSNCPGDREETRYCHNNGTCFDPKNLCFNDTKYGPDCNTSCSNISDYCKKCNREGKCTACTDKKHSGDKCKEQCDHCSEEGCNIKGYCREFKCPNESYGLECAQKCQCGSNSNEGICGKFRGQCSECKFGYYGKKCDLRCNYKCQTELCCLFNEHSDENMTVLKIETNYKIIEIKINEKPYRFEIDYNYGYPLTIFNGKTQLDNCDNYGIEPTDYQDVSSKEEYHEKFTNFEITSYLNNGQKITINGNVDITTDIAVALRAKCLSKEGMKEKINGVIGFGFFNSISNAIFTNSTHEDYKLNILSFDYKAEGDQIEMLFGDLFTVQRNYVEKLTSCKVILDGKTDIQEKKMTCQLDGIKVSKYSEAFKLNKSYITFSLGEKSSLILGNNKNYFEYLKRGFFNDENINLIDDKENEGIQYILYPNNKINKLSDFGFVFNNFAYSYPPDKFFVNFSNSNNGEGESQFLIKINKKTDRTEFIIGREFFSDIKFTINNEEAQIYFYAQNAQYTDKFTDVITDSLFKIKLNSRATAGICLAIIVFIYLVAFTIYYLVKRKKMKSGDYIRIE